MPSIKLYDHEVEDRLLPDVCMCCGEPATIHRDRKFSWYPTWSFLVGGVILALIMTKKMTVNVPLCDRHKSHWSMRTIFGLLGFLFVIALVIIAVAVNVSADGQSSGFEWLGVVIVFLAWLVAFAVLQTTAIRPTEITDRGITLTSVSAEFIDALDAFRDEECARRRRFREEGDFEPRRERPARLADDDRVRRERDVEGPDEYR